MTEAPPLIARKPAAIELFAGVGGFRLGLERAGWEVAWSNQWEPGARVQHASRCYQHHFNPAPRFDDPRATTNGVHVTADMKVVLDAVEAGWYSIPDHVLLTAGFPCQDYSVAKAVTRSTGIEGLKGVLWWEIHRMLRLLSLENRQPRFLLLENVDRLLKSPASQRGRDFAIMLASLNDLGYEVEWRVVNAADYGLPQRRRRVFIFGRLHESEAAPLGLMTHLGVLARAFPTFQSLTQIPEPSFRLQGSLAELTTTFGALQGGSPFRGGGVARRREVWTRDLEPLFEGEFATLRSILEPVDRVPTHFSVPPDQIPRWRVLKNAKRVQRFHRSGNPYLYIEGSIPFPDPLDRAARTLTTTEGGTSPSRFRHVVETSPGQYRRLTPVELERLSGFPDGWTDVDVPDGRRAFLMGNAVIVDLVEAVGQVLARDMVDSADQETALAAS